MEPTEILTFLNTGGLMAGLVLALVGGIQGWWFPSRALRLVVREVVIAVLDELDLLPPSE